MLILSQKMLNTQDGLYSVIAKKESGELTTSVIGSIVGMDHLLDTPETVLKNFTNPNIRLVSLTITEGGYPVSTDTLKFNPEHLSVKADITNHNKVPTTTFGLLVRALEMRKELNLAPFTILSCDNIPHNGDITRQSTLSMADCYTPHIRNWIEESVSFPNCMVDRITPATTTEDRIFLTKFYNLVDQWPVTCEPFCQWIIEDKFNAGRPDWEQVGVQVTADVTPYELVKLRMLNAGHQLIGHVGRLLGLTYSHETIQNSKIKALLFRFLTCEAIPTLKRPEGFDLFTYRDCLLTRFGNPAIKDSLDRLCAFASDRIPKFLLATIKDNLTAHGEIGCAALVIASWAIGIQGLDNQGKPIKIIDPLSKSLLEASLKDNSYPGAFLDHPIFEGLGKNNRLRDIYRKTSIQIKQIGIEKTIDELLKIAI